MTQHTNLSHRLCAICKYNFTTISCVILTSILAIIVHQVLISTNIDTTIVYLFRGTNVSTWMMLLLNCRLKIALKLN